MCLRGLLHRPPLHVVVKPLHDGQPLLQYGRGVVRVVVGGRPEGEEQENSVQESCKIGSEKVKTIPNVEV